MANLKDTLVLGKLTATDSIIANRFTQGSPSVDSSIINMNRFESDLFVSGNGVAPNIPTVPGFYLGRSETDENRHIDIVSGSECAYIDFNGKSVTDISNNPLDYSVRLITNVYTGLTQFQWGSMKQIDDDHKIDKRLNIGGDLSVSSNLTVGGGLTVNGGSLKVGKKDVVVNNGNTWDISISGTAAAADKLNTAAIGSTTKPVYFTADGVPATCLYSLGKTVPSDAVFTDTTYSAGTGLSLSGTTFSVSIDNNITGTGTRTANYIAKFSGTNTIGESSIIENGSEVITGRPIKGSNSTASIYPSDSNEVSFGSNANSIYFGYDNRAKSSVLVNTYVFGQHAGATNNAYCRGNIECGELRINGTANGQKGRFRYNSADNCIDIVFE